MTPIATCMPRSRAVPQPSSQSGHASLPAGCEDTLEPVTVKAVVRVWTIQAPQVLQALRSGLV